MQATNTRWLATLPRTLPVAAAFILGVLLLLLALFLQINTYAPGADAVPGCTALTFTLAADACFLWLIWRGGWVVRVFALLGGSAALFNTYCLVRWVVLTIYH